MVLYRPHTGSIDKSMEQVVEVANIDVLRSYLDEPEATVKLYFDEPDERIGWEQTCIVLDSDGRPMGYTDGMI